MSVAHAPSGAKTRLIPYGDFRGISTSRDETALESGQDQYLTSLDNGYCDSEGQIVRDATCSKRTGERAIEHVRFYARNSLIWAERQDAGLELVSERGHRSDIAFAPNSVVSTAVFNRNVVAASRNQPGWFYSGARWDVAPGPLQSLGASYLVTGQRRLCVAGIPGMETQVHVSRVDRLDILPQNEDPASNSVLRAATIDIANVLQSADEITGLGIWEQNRLCIFTADRCIPYVIDPDVSNWVIDDRANIQIGCASHNTITSAGTDLLFCSRSGVHSLRRAAQAGVVVYSFPLSDRVGILYRRLFDSVPDPEQINAVWDQDEAQYHVFFPQRGGLLCTRLTLTFDPANEAIMNWSTGTFLQARCGAFLGGQLVLGTPSGLYDVNEMESEEGERPPLEFTTPILWHGNVVDTKESTHFILRASGKGQLDIEAHDEQGRLLYTHTLEVDADDNGQYPDTPLARQYQLKFERRYRGVQFRFRCPGPGALRIQGLAVVIRSQ